MFIVIIAIILGIVLGFYLPVPTNQVISLYFIVAIFAALDSIMGAIRSILSDEYDSKIFISGVILNTVVAVVLAYIGDKLGLPLYYAAIFVFGTRIFSNISIIRRLVIISNRAKKMVNKKNNRRRIYEISIRKRQK